ncbi:MAG: ABC transporter permease [Methanocalculus sp.]|uniref:ABC transporter permease n=1 Tax=Methanocalculus sp. TaxID=2004547 RepID=UPI00271BDCBF|nr:ABC transporter permease [Methanocalculus sp.]MDO8840872.1 ABC transporter permease [Methanocalculus sp.]MDO9539435.1 ABC transporter permease [Methanocalculus sp.]
MAQISLIRDRCLISFSLLGGVILGLTVLALLNMTVKELSDIPHLLRVATDTKVIDSIVLTMAAGANAILILMIFGIPLAYLLARADFKGKRIIETIVDIPLMLPHTVAGILVYILFMKRGLLGAPLYTIGFPFEDAYPGIVVAMLFVSSPYFINSAREGFEKVPVHLENVARTLGATRLSAFRHVVLPLSAREIYNGAILAWGRAIGEFAAVIMIAYYPMVISTLIYYRFSTSGIKESSTIAFVMILACFSVFLVLRHLSRFIGRHDDRV